MQYLLAWQQNKAVKKFEIFCVQVVRIMTSRFVSSWEDKLRKLLERKDCIQQVF